MAVNLKALPPIVFLDPVPVFQGFFAVNCIVAVCMLTVVGLRIYSRISLKAGIGWDDGFILAAVPLALAILVISGFFGHLFIGHTYKEIPIQNQLLVSRLLFPYELIYVLTVGATKISVLCFYLRVFVEPQIRLGAKILLVIVALGEIGLIITPFAMCRPWQAVYDKTITKKSCGNQHASLVAMGVWAMITDFAVLSLPIPSMLKLQMNKNKRAALILVFSIGFLATLVATARVYVLVDVYTPTTPNASMTAVWPDFLAVLEPNLSILCISLPMLGSLFKRFRARGSSAAASNGYNGAYYAANSKNSRRPTNPGGTGVKSLNDSGFRRMTEDEQDDAIQMKTMRTTTECRADANSETGSETALAGLASPRMAAHPPHQGQQQQDPYGNNYGPEQNHGITVSRTVRVHADGI